jgi:hypothetical protein
VVRLGNKISSSDGFTFSSDGRLLMTAIENNTIYEIKRSVIDAAIESGSNEKGDSLVRENLNEVVSINAS